MVGRPENEANGLSAIRSAGRAIAPLHDPIGTTKEGDWLDEHEEPGQSFDEDLVGLPSRSGRTILPAGRVRRAVRAAARGGILEEVRACGQGKTGHDGALTIQGRRIESSEPACPS